MAIETAKGLLVANCAPPVCRCVAINPLSVLPLSRPLLTQPDQERRRRRLVLANILRTDPHSHRPLPETPSWPQHPRARPRPSGRGLGPMQIANKLRSVLRDYYPTFLAAFDDLTSREARSTLRTGVVTPMAVTAAQVPA